MNQARTTPRYPLGGSEAHPLEWLGLIALVTLGFLASLLWAAGQISGWLFRSQWPATGARDMGGILVRFGSHVSDPAAAWPAAQRHFIPGPLAFYTVLAGLLLPLIAAAVWLILRRADRRSESRENVARWASPKDLQLLQVGEPQPGRLTLGHAGRTLLAAEPKQSAIVIGPVQTGKTSGFAVPAILEWQGPVVATSVKSDLMRDTLAARSAIPDAEVFVYDPTGGTGEPSCIWTPLASCNTWKGALQVSSWLVDSAGHAGSGLENAQFWNRAAAKLLAPVLFAAATSGRTMADVVRWIDLQTEEDIRWALEAADNMEAISSFEASALRDDRTRSGIYTTAETILAAYADPGVLQSAAPASHHDQNEEPHQLELDLDDEPPAVPELRPDRLLDGGWHTAYICAPTHEQRRLQPLFATLVQSIVNAAEAAATRQGRLQTPLLLVLDECANIAPIPSLAQLASTAAGQGIQLVTVFQDMAQIASVYGRDEAPTIVSNHRARIILSGIADAQTHEYVGRMLGEEEVHQTASTRGAEGRSSRTESVMYRSLAPANALREMRPGRGLLVYGTIPPAKLHLRPWFRDRRLRSLAEANGATLAGRSR